MLPIVDESMSVMKIMMMMMMMMMMVMVMVVMMVDCKARFPLPELKARVNGPS